MPRIRTIKPEFFTHWDLFNLERETKLPCRVAFAGLWTLADREGRFRWIPQQLKLGCLPYDDIDFSRVLDALASRGFIVKYRVDDQDFGCIPGWNKHQVINNRESQSSLPEPNGINTLTREVRVDDACPTPLEHAQAERKGRERKGKEGKILMPEFLAEGFENFWRAYDKKIDRFECERIWSRLSPSADLIAKIYISASRYRASTPDKKFRKDPSTWLNGRCWENEIIDRRPETSGPVKTQHQLNQEAIARSIGLIPKDEPTIIDGGMIYDVTESAPKLLG